MTDDDFQRRCDELEAWLRYKASRHGCHHPSSRKPMSWPDDQPPDEHDRTGEPPTEDAGS